MRSARRLPYGDTVLALPWTGVRRSDPLGVCTIFAGRLPMRSYRHMPRLLWFAARIRRQLSHTPGVLGYAFALDLRSTALWTVSAWSDRASLATFDRTAPHRTARRVLGSVMLPPTFAVWTWRIDQLPVPWHETRMRVREAGSGS